MAKLRHFDWRQESAALIDAQDKHLWIEEEATSFSHWLQTRAQAEGIKISLLWRYLRVGRFVKELQVGYWANVSSPLGVPAGINADAIELLEKINRVATEADFKVLADDLYLKKIKRPFLLKTWQIYREALPAGTTARGLGTQRPTLDHKNAHKLRLSLTQSVLAALAATHPQALGYPGDAALRMVNNVSDRKKAYGYNALLVVFTNQAVIDTTLVVIDTSNDTEDRQAALARFKQERLWWITTADCPLNDNPDSSPATAHSVETNANPQTAVHNHYPPQWGVIRADASSLQILKTPTPAVAPLTVPASELLLDFL
jgi:hypothetical protein